MRERRGLERFSAARPGPLAPEPGESPGDEAEARRKAAEAAAHPNELPRPPVVAGPGQEELGPGGKPGTTSGQPGWGDTPVACRGGGETLPAAPRPIRSREGAPR